MHSSNVKKISCGLIVLITLFISISNAFKLFKLVEKKPLELNHEMSQREQIGVMEHYINENFYRKTDFINAYGWIQDLLHKDEFDNFDVIRDQQGKLHYSFYATQPNDVSEILFEMMDYKQALDYLGIPLMFVMAPDKFVPGYTSFDKGLPYNFANETADVFLEELAKQQINSVDLRIGLKQSELNPSDVFFKTDHHWTPEAAFVGFRQLSDALETSFDINLDPENVYTNLNDYQTEVFKQDFLGSLGRRTGVFYSGLDDMSIITPTFETLMTYTWVENGMELELQGDFNTALIERGWSLEAGVPLETRDRYSAYLGGNKVEATIKNKLKPDGLKILMIKDSFMLPLAAFLSTEVYEIKMIDLRYYDEMDMAELAKMYDPDVVIVGVNPTSLVPEFFNFKLK